MQLFHTYAVHWQGHRLADPALEHAHQVLLNPIGDYAYPERDQAFLTLLRSGHAPAVAIALDHYKHADALTRHGPDSPYQAHADEVRERARELLGRSPFPAEPADGVNPGATYASAMGVMMDAAEPQDAELIAHALEHDTVRDDGEVWQVGLWAAGTALAGAHPPSQRLMTLLDAIVWDDTADETKRGGALAALGYAETPEPLDTVLRAAAQPNLRLQVEAGLILADKYLDTHRELVQRLVDSWPAHGIYYMAEEVREMLDEAAN